MGLGTPSPRHHEKVFRQPGIHQAECHLVDGPGANREEIQNRFDPEAGALEPFVQNARRGVVDASLLITPQQTPDSTVIPNSFSKSRKLRKIRDQGNYGAIFREKAGKGRNDFNRIRDEMKGVR